MDLTTILEDGRKDLLDAARGLADEQAAAKPAADRWSILECIEHVVMVENRFLGWIESGSVIDTPKSNPENEARIRAMASDRSTKVQAPEVVVPKGRFSTLANALTEFNEVRDRSIRTAQERRDALYSISAAHPRFGPLNGAEVVHMIAGHASRHAAQIRETRAAVTQRL